VTAYALRLENATDTAARVRLGDLLGLTPAGPLTARSGIRPAPGAGDVAVSAGTMQVTVQPFVAWVQGGVSTAQGGYPFVLDATKTLTLANGHATLSRTDVIAAVVHDDPYDGSGLLDADVVVVTGTPGAGAPALPSNCLPLRNVTVPAGASSGTGGLVAGNLSTDRRTYTSGLGGVVTVASQAERDALPATKGTIVYRTDTDTLEVRHASGWVEYVHNTDVGWTAITVTGAGWSGGAQYSIRGGIVTLIFSCDKATFGTNETLFTLPAGARPPATAGWTGIDGSGSGAPRTFYVATSGDVNVFASTTSVWGTATYAAA
jgi:hypothetical protein